MKLYFMKQEALEILKSNLDIVYNKYYTEKDNKWLWQVCGGNPFVEFKDVADFKLASLDSEKTTGEIELENCKILYEKLSFLNESQASDERLWAGLCHSVFYDYVRKRYDYDGVQPKNAKVAVSNIKSRFFFSGGTRSGLYRNTLAKCWWVGRNTFDPLNENHFESLDIIGNNDISTKISDIFYSNTFSSNPVILKGIVEGLRYFKNEGIQLTVKEHIRPTLKVLNAIGGGIVLDCLSTDDISDIFIDNVYSIIQGDDKLIESDDEGEDENLELDESNEKEEDDYISLGENIEAKILETGEIKIIKIDYFQDTTNIPPLVKLLLGKRIGESVEFSGKTYLIEKIV